MLQTRQQQLVQTQQQLEQHLTIEQLDEIIKTLDSIRQSMIQGREAFRKQIRRDSLITSEAGQDTESVMRNGLKQQEANRYVQKIILCLTMYQGAPFEQRLQQAREITRLCKLAMNRKEELQVQQLQQQEEQIQETIQRPQLKE